MEYFGKYVSNTLAGSGNQSFFCPEDPAKIETCRIFYKLTAGGRFPYSLLFTNIIDSTYSDGSHSAMNRICDSWTLTSAKLAVCPASETAPAPETVTGFLPLTFDGSPVKKVAPAEFFASDPVMLDAQSGDWLCTELSYCGRMLPCHPESILSSYVRKNGAWEAEKAHPFPSMIGCERPVKLRVGFLGDSITQGIGTPVDAYTHWNAVAAGILGNDYSYWNLGLGFGRANDAAGDGAWLFKAKQMDAVVVCFGVNDICQLKNPALTCRDLDAILTKLQSAGVKVLQQTVPPYEYGEGALPLWYEVNDFIRAKLFPKADAVLDLSPVLCHPETGDEPLHRGRWLTHPDEEGCAVWGRAMAPVLSGLLRSMEA